MSRAGRFNYDNLFFKSVNNTDNGEVSAETLFHYHQEDNVVWATYQGGDIRFGTLTGTIDNNGYLNFAYQHENTQGVIRTGRCISTPERMSDGRIRLTESWQWTDEEGGRGTSIVEEVSS